MIKRALISVYDKSGLDTLAAFLLGHGVELFCSGGTQDYLNRLGMQVRKLEELSGVGQMLGGRVKTLHPSIFAPILARDDQLGELQQHEMVPFDLVVVNLYPFEEAVGAGAPLDEALENIDIGGSALLRAAAKNFPRVTVICGQEDYQSLIEELKANDLQTSVDFRRRMALKAFARSCAYDSAIAEYLAGKDRLFAENLIISLQKLQSLRYGENPHQKAALYIDPAYRGVSLGKVRLLSGKELSFNNIWDMEAGLQMALDFADPFAAIIKHASPCGAAAGLSLAEAYQKALACDPLSAFGCVIALNRPVDLGTARLIHETEFVECVIAPDYEAEALELLRRKKARRLVAVGELTPPVESDFEIRYLLGGALAQTRDRYQLTAQELRVVTKVQPSADQIEDLLFAFKVVKHVKSNAILICRNRASVGIGGGQPSRVDASLIAVRKAGSRADGAVAASDAFFPMPDGLQVLVEAGVKAVIQPGGSKQDAEVIAAADKAGIAMLFTGIRHFRH